MHFTWPTFHKLIWFSVRNVTNDKSETYEALYETVCGDEIRKTLNLTNFSMVNMILFA